MKKNKVLLTKTGDTYNCRYVLDQTDIIDEKVDKGVSGLYRTDWKRKIIRENLFMRLATRYS